MTFEITSDRATEIVTAQSWADLSIPSKATRVEALDRKQLKRDMRGVNGALHALGRDYDDPLTLNQKLNAMLREYGFTEIEQDVTRTPELRNIAIGRGVYLTVTTYRMPSGRYEFVGYVS